MTADLTRRIAVTAMLAVSALAAAPAAAAIESDRAAWNRAVRRYQAACARHRTAMEAHEHALEAYYAERPDRPSFTMEIEGDYGRFGKHVLPILITHEELDDLNRSWRDPERVEAMRADLRTYRATEAALRTRLDIDALDNAQRRTSNHQYRTLKALLREPAPDAAALAAKLRITLDEYGDEDGNTAAVLTDVCRLMKVES